MIQYEEGDGGYFKTLFKQNKLDEYIQVNATKSFANDMISYDKLENLLNWNAPEDHRYFSEQDENPFILFELKKNIQSFNMYSFQTHNTRDISFPTHWIVEGSNHLNDDWKTLDERNVTLLNDYNRIVNFTMKESHHKYLKFTLKSNYYNRDDYESTFAIRRIDFFLTTTCRTYYIGKINAFSHKFLIIIVLLF